jgi:small subunit ribosomal protein S19e
MMYKVNQQELVLQTAQELKKHIEMPQWAQFVKTGVHRETIPRNPDWWYIRAASILRMCHKLGPIGVSKLRTKYGGRQNRGMKPDKFALASGKVIRVILQQLQSAGLIKEHTVGVHKGRIATPAGASILAKAAKAVGLPKEDAPKTKKIKIVEVEEENTESVDKEVEGEQDE